MVVSAIVGVLSHGLRSRGAESSGGAVWELLGEIVALMPSLSLPVSLVRSMPNVETPAGRVRALLRLAMSDRSLADFITVLCRAPALQADWYEPWSFARDVETGLTLQTLIGGLGPVLVAFDWRCPDDKLAAPAPTFA